MEYVINSLSQTNEMLGLATWGDWSELISVSIQFWKLALACEIETDLHRNHPYYTLPSTPRTRVLTLVTHIRTFSLELMVCRNGVRTFEIIREGSQEFGSHCSNQGVNMVTFTI